VLPFARPLADVLHIGEKKGEKYPLQMALTSKTKTSYSILKNPENPDSKPDESG
jgi:hypothetical protein